MFKPSTHLDKGCASPRPIGLSAARGVALFLAGFILFGLLASRRGAAFDANLLWIDLRWLPGWSAELLLGSLAAFLVIFAVAPAATPVRRKALLLLLTCSAVITVVNASVFWMLAARGTIRAASPLPASIVFLAALAYIGASAWKIRPPCQLNRAAFAGAFLASVLVFPIVQVVCFGKTDYRRPADVAVVFGARVYADGRLSDAVADRVRTACELYQQGLVRRLILSGGPGDGATHETEAMQLAAMRWGVPAEVIARDTEGLNTAATVRNTVGFTPAGEPFRVLAVSEFYHLPRIKLAFAASGREVFTVPARPSHWQRAWALRNVVREVPAFWYYFLRAGLAA